MLGFGPFLDGYHDVENQMIDYLRSRAETLIAKRYLKKQRISNIEELNAYREEVLAHFRKALGGLPQSSEPLHAKTTGVILGQGFSVEKVIFQSLPGFYVTCNLYLPQTSAPSPGVIFACGHAREGKAYPVYQKVCLDLVANGFAVLAVDPLSQGERFQYWRKGKEDVTWGIFEHTFAGIKCSLLGMSIARFFCWDLIRALDYLCTRPEIDSTKLGITGNSGGGTQTTYLMLLDDRIKAAVPCTYLTSRFAYLKTGQAHDMEQNLNAAIAHSPAHDDYLALFAPKPVMVGAVESDFFNLEGTVKSVELARKYYQFYHADDNLKLTIAPGTHAYAPALREAAVNWFRVHLLHQSPDFKTQDPIPYDPRELFCTKTGQIIDDFPQARTIHDLLVTELEQRKMGEFSLEQLKITLGHEKSTEPVYPRIIADEVVADGIHREKIFFWSEPGILISGLYFRNEAATLEPVFLLLEDGTAQVEQAWELINSLLGEGRDVFLLDPRLKGAVASRPLNNNDYAYNFFGTEYRLSCDAQMLGSSVVGMQVTDVLRGIEYLLARTGKEQVVLAGRDQGALLATLAAPLAPTSQLRLSPLPPSFAQIIKTRIYPLQRAPLLFGPLQHWDLPDLFAELKKQNVMVYQQLHLPLSPPL